MKKLFESQSALKQKYKLFSAFIESLRTSDNIALVESILNGIKILTESTFKEEWSPNGRARRDIVNKIKRDGEKLGLHDVLTNWDEKKKLYDTVSKTNGPNAALYVFYPDIADAVMYQIPSDSLDSERDELMTASIDKIGPDVIKGYDPSKGAISTYIRQFIVGSRSGREDTGLEKRREYNVQTLSLPAIGCMLALPTANDPSKPNMRKIYGQVVSGDGNPNWNVKFGSKGHVIEMSEDEIMDKFVPFNVGTSANMGLIKSAGNGSSKNDGETETMIEPTKAHGNEGVVYTHLLDNVISNIDNEVINEIIPNKNPKEIKKFIKEYALTKNKISTVDKSEDNSRTQTKAGNAASAKISQTKAQIIAGLVMDKGESVENAKSTLKTLIAQKEAIENKIAESNNELDYSSPEIKPMVDKMSEQVKGFVYRDTKGKEVVPKWDSNTSKGYEYGDDDVGMRLLDRLYNMIHRRTETTGFTTTGAQVLNKYGVTHTQADKLLSELNDAIKNNDTIRQLFGQDRNENHLITQARNRMRNKAASRYSSNPDVDAEIRNMITHGND